MAGNSNLHMSKAGKTDEFYTQLSTIEEELRHYRKYFKGKKVLCNCDDPYESNFFKYFALNFNALGLKKLITTCYATSPITYTQLSLFADEEITYPAGEGKKPYKIEITEVTDANGDATVDLSDVEYLLRNKKNALTLLNEDGDFRSKECIALLTECDIVVTNPPFSLMKEYIPLLAESGKLFLVLGNMNHITFKEIFHYFRENKMWLGYNAGHFWFKVPDYYEAKNTDYKQDEDGQKWRRLGNICWFTNMDIDIRHQFLDLYKHFSIQEYPEYDNYDAYFVKTVADIPCDTDKPLAVPITFLSSFSPDQFELLDANQFRKYDEVPVKSHGLIKDKDGTIKGKATYARLLVRNRNPEKE
ncbi:MAG: adenine-specific methyltransferase EcoRI family protein [Ruminococcus sp.]|nr:adenine-specific methyltransferase EcoRI family protein [Ruminococcus sp.]